MGRMEDQGDAPGQPHSCLAAKGAAHCEAVDNGRMQYTKVLEACSRSATC